MSRPRVLFLDHAASLGGAELYLLDLLRSTADTALVITLQEGPFADALRSEGIGVEVVHAPAALLGVEREADLWRGLLSAPAVLQTVLQVARRLRSFDLLYANSQKALIVGGLAGFLARRPVIWNLHDILTADHFSAFNRALAVRWSGWFADRVITNSRATLAAFIASGGDPERAHVVYNGIDPAPFDAVSEEDVAGIRSELGLDSVPVVGVFSRLAEWKGQHVLLDALRELDGVHAVLVGEPLFEPDRAYARRLRTRAQSEGVAERVHFLGFRNDIPRLMRAVDVVAHTSVAPEPFGRVIVEGMLAGTPVVATRAGGALELIEDGKTGLLVEPGDAGALRAALRALLDGDHGEPLVRRASKLARRQFSLNAVREQIWHHIREVAGEVHHPTEASPPS